MKALLITVLFTLSGLALKAQLNSDTAASRDYRKIRYDDRLNCVRNHMHPQFMNIANPNGPGYDMDGTVYHSDAIVNRHPTNINELIR